MYWFAMMPAEKSRFNLANALPYPSRWPPPDTCADNFSKNNRNCLYPINFGQTREATTRCGFQRTRMAGNDKFTQLENELYNTAVFIFNLCLP